MGCTCYAYFMICIKETAYVFLYAPITVPSLTTKFTSFVLKMICYVVCQRYLYIQF